MQLWFLGMRVCGLRVELSLKLAKERVIIEAEYHSNNRPSRLDNLDF